VLSKQRDINLILGNITRRRSGGRRTHETLARAQNRAEKSGEEETAAELPRKRVKSEDGTPRPVSAVAPLASVSISANPTLHECNDNEKRSVSHDNSALVSLAGKLFRPFARLMSCRVFERKSSHGRHLNARIE